MPSSVERTTSVASPRIVRVAGTTISSLSVSITVERVSSRTGRRLSGAANVYQRISPRRTGRLPTFALPGTTIVFVRELVRAYRLLAVDARVARTVARCLQRELREPHLLFVGQLLDERKQVLSLERLRHDYTVRQLAGRANDCE